MKKAETNLYKLSKQFEEAEKLNSMIKETFESILLTEKMTEENPSLNPLAEKEIKEKKLVSLYKQMEEKLNEAKQKINSFEDQSIRSKLFLEGFRTTRTYTFPDMQAMNEFIKQAYELFSISMVQFKPEFVGTVNLESIAAELKEEAKGNQILNIPSEKLFDLMELIEKKGIHKNARIENALLKISLKGSNTLVVDSDNTRIRRLDRLCKELNGNWTAE